MYLKWILNGRNIIVNIILVAALIELKLTKNNTWSDN
jgi:hypothetical protein